MMSPSWSKVFRDFWRERARTSLVAFTIAIGIAAFSSVLASYAILTRELNLGWLETNPASATIQTDRVDDALVAELAAQPGVGRIETRRTLTGMIKTGPVEWRNLVLFVVRDFEHVRVSTRPPRGKSSSSATPFRWRKPASATS
jgi:putative ABC transport system permease protein